MTDLHWATVQSKVRAYHDLVQEALYNKVIPTALREALDDAIKELLRDKAKLLESNQNLTSIALEIEEERASLNSLLVAAYAVSPDFSEDGYEEWLQQLRDRIGME